VGKVVHPWRVTSFRKAVSTVTDDLGMDFETIENFNLIVKLENQGVSRIAFLLGFEDVILVDRFS
jgi:hypothetical protein